MDMMVYLEIGAMGPETPVEVMRFGLVCQMRSGRWVSG